MLATLGLVVFAMPAASVRADAGDDWLGYLNTIRALANLPPVTENPDWSASDLKHSTYLVENNVGFADDPHREDASAPFATPEGAIASKDGNIDRSTGLLTGRDAIDGWMTAPFHALGLIDPTLGQVGFGLYAKRDAPRDAIKAAATLDVIRGRTGRWTAPVMFPADGKTLPYTDFPGQESPDPLTSCPGYTAPTGPPIMLLLGATPTVTDFAVTRDGAPAPRESCLITETTYTNPDSDVQAATRRGLAMRHAIILFPRAPLAGGVYDVSITADGTTYAWSFTVPTLQSVTLTPATVTIPVGETQQFSATATYSDGSSVDISRRVQQWSWQGTGRLTLSVPLTVTGVTPGTTTIIVPYGGMTATATVTITG
jgi:hypothetical protein